MMRLGGDDYMLRSRIDWIMSIFSYLNRAALRRKQRLIKHHAKILNPIANMNFLGFEIPDELLVLKEKFTQKIRIRSYSSNSYVNRKSGEDF